MGEINMLYVWLALFIVFLITEAVTAQLTTIWFACGALVALILELCGVQSIPIQLIVFAAVSVVTLIATRPLVKKILNRKKQATNADRNVGEEAVVCELIDNIAGTGAVNLNGVQWSARSADAEILNIGEHVIVKRIEGVKLIVSKR